MRRICYLLTALALLVSPAAQSDVISGDAVFTIVDPAVGEIGSGSFVLENSHVLDFELIVGDDIYDEFDIGHRCACVSFLPGEVSGVGFSFGDVGPGVDDFWILTFQFFDAVFGFRYEVGDTSIFATADNGIHPIGEFNLRAHVPEPGSLALVSLGLLGLGLTRRQSSVANARGAGHVVQAKH